LLTPIEYRFTSDMAMTGKKDGEWVRWEPKLSWIGYLRRWLRRLRQLFQ